MIPYFYIKKPVKLIKKASKKPLVLSSILFLSGLLLIGLVVWPIASFEIMVAPNLSKQVVSPVAEEQILGSQTDLTKALNWFPTASSPPSIPSKITSYSLSISKLGIQDATVTINSDNLSQSLVQWGSQSLPGEFGSIVILGHSVLPAFYNPKNYMTIFSTLKDLKNGDEILIYFDGITYKYRIFEMRVVKSEDISVLEQRFDDSYVTLVTCVPPGTYLRRLLVKARLVKI